MPHSAQRIRTGEWLLISYFVWNGCRAAVEGAGVLRVATAVVLSAFVIAVARSDSPGGPRWLAVVRNLTPAAMVLPAYWQTRWFSKAPDPLLAEQFMAVDRVLLNDWGLYAAFHALGPAPVAVLEVAYLLLYSIPPVAIGLVYWFRRGEQIDRYLSIFLAGTLLVYALIPSFPVLPPRVVYPGEHLPHAPMLLRTANEVLLQRFNVAVSVFPSGHVGVAFSAALGLARVLGDRKWVTRGAFTLAALVFLATFFPRYHYAVDGIASIGLCTLAAMAVRWYER